MFRRSRTEKARRGLTLLELLIAIAILGMIGGTLAALAKAVESSYQYTQSAGTVTQHARVALERIARAASDATASQDFPGFLVVAQQIDAYRFPDTLVAWYPGPGRKAADPVGRPRYNELVIYTPDPSAPNRLLEITVPEDTRVVPAWKDAAAWADAVSAIKKSAAAKRVELTDLLRVAAARGGSSPVNLGAIRFEQMLRPTDDELAAYRVAAAQGEAQGRQAWAQLPWVLSISNNTMGLRQSWLRVELQMTPTVAGTEVGVQETLTFFGSASVVYTSTPAWVQSP